MRKDMKWRYDLEAETVHRNLYHSWRLNFGSVVLFKCLDSCVCMLWMKTRCLIIAALNKTAQKTSEGANQEKMAHGNLSERSRDSTGTLNILSSCDLTLHLITKCGFISSGSCFLWLNDRIPEWDCIGRSLFSKLTSVLAYSGGQLLKLIFHSACTCFLLLHLCML